MLPSASMKVQIIVISVGSSDGSILSIARVPSAVTPSFSSVLSILAHFSLNRSPNSIFASVSILATDMFLRFAFRTPPSSFRVAVPGWAKNGSSSLEFKNSVTAEKAASSRSIPSSDRVLS